MYIFAIVNPNTMKTGTIFSIEEFAIHDGPGIRTTIFLKGCPLHCAWCHNPEGISPQPQYMIKKGVKSICGYQITVEELIAIIEKNRDIYRLNRGGITLTGGEPLFQPDFITELLEQLPDIHTAIETSGYANTHTFSKVISLANLILFDIKHTDPEMHRKYTGVDNTIILKNLTVLCDSGQDFILRIPLIPGVNDTRENMTAIFERIKNAQNLIRVEILRYHRTAGAKYAMIGEKYHPPFDTGKTPQIYNVFEENNIKSLIV
ncbi:glycyl-radical enzyme activating protein [Bacteroides hominis]|uniref:glycyl-radical enzyme activating protein n=1 Tax=Bacteroides hominis TaxID=2763023 RepID=UPI00294923B7|nr:glycyl-radical enzyme activating protein [Bacteroides hominis (ex Liu et al. 2022)]MDV6133678.1 glycyl-radical enzyme activating protein [Bacteroides hominis (ex Liu et al. 2022)]MDV6150976.1 glycyl-radical enzyme activating protein [Bacteroides hominis (ex Liu et al. 2022)]